MLSRFDRACLALIALGIASRLFAFWAPTIDYDGGHYMQYAASLLQHGEFIRYWEDPPRFSHHFPPTYPVIIALFFAVFGVHTWVGHLAAFACGLLLLGVAYWTTKDLYGRRGGLFVAAFLACFAPLIVSDHFIRTESLATALLMLTLWSIVRSLQEPRFIVWGGLFAGLAYLTKSSMGPFFLVAGLSGLLWRVAYVRWRVFTDRHYLAAAGIFATFVLAWAARNVARSGWPHWQTQPHAYNAVDAFFQHPEWPSILLKDGLFALLVLAAFAAPVLPYAAKSLRRFRDQATSMLWLTVALNGVIAALFISAFYVYEGRVLYDQVTAGRYVMAAVAPILWLAVPYLRLDEPRLPPGPPKAGARRVQARAALAWAGVAVVALAVALQPRTGLTRELVLGYFATVALGVAFVAASRAFDWRPVERDVRGLLEWKAAPSPYPWLLLAWAVAATAVGIYASIFLTLLFLPFFAAAAIVPLMRDHREGMVAGALVLLALSLTGGAISGSDEELADDLLQDPTRTVGVLGADAPFVAIFLDGKMEMVPPLQRPDRLVDITGDPPTAPEGYVLWKTYYATPHERPGTWAFRQLRGDAPLTPFVDAHVYAREGTV